MSLVKSGANPSLVNSSGEAISRTASVAIAKSTIAGLGCRPQAPLRRIELTGRVGASRSAALLLDMRVDFLETGKTQHLLILAAGQIACGVSAVYDIHG
jgi:hypothetical protein